MDPLKNVALKSFQKIAKGFHGELDELFLPPSEGLPSYSEKVVIFSLVKGTRGYIERIVHQMNGSYEKGWYDACAVMIRRLIETLIIEVFMANHIAQKIRDSKGDFLFLGDLIDCILNEGSWNLGRNAKTSLKKFKDVGDKSAHSRRFIAHRQDIDKLISDLRVVVQELVYLSNLRR
jgi:hypothetical protein